MNAGPGVSGSVFDALTHRRRPSRGALGNNWFLLYRNTDGSEYIMLYSILDKGSIGTLKVS